MIILRDALRDLLYYRYTLPYLHCGVVVQFLLDNWGQSPNQHSNSLPACWFRGMRSPKWPGSSLSFQFNGIIAPLDGSISPSTTKTYRPAEHKVTRKESKNFANGSLGVIVSGATPISIPSLLDLWILAIGETVPYIGYWFRAYAAFWRTLPQPSMVFPFGYLTCTVTESSKGHFCTLPRLLF